MTQPILKINQPNGHLAHVIAEVLDTPLQEATEILRAVFDSIISALLRGETVRIKGFGTFRVVRKKLHPMPNSILLSKGRSRPIANATSLTHYKPRMVVVFEPSIPLRAMLNIDSPNYKERRAQQLWSGTMADEN